MESGESLTGERPVFRVHYEDCGQVYATQPLWQEQSFGQKSLIFVVKCSGRQNQLCSAVCSLSTHYQLSSFLFFLFSF